MLVARTALPKCLLYKTLFTCRSLWFSEQASTQARQSSTSPAPTASKDEVQAKVKIGLHQHVDLVIRQPPKPEDNAPIVLFLHRGLSSPSLPMPCIDELATSANAVVVQLDYQVSKEHPYPFAIHSVLAGYDWIQRHLLPSRYSRNDSLRVTERKPPRIGVCGELIGGSLATMLALTECHGEKRGAIRAAAVSNPLVDWTALVEPPEESLGGTSIKTSLKAKNPKRSKEPNPQQGSVDRIDSIPSRATLLSLRSQYFRKPEKYFDAFASPLLFFRTPRYAVPGSIVNMDPAEAEYASSSDKEQEREQEQEPELVKMRLSHRKYPPTGSGLVLPRMRLEVGENSVVSDQGRETVELWRRSLGKREGPGAGADAEENEIEDVVVRKGSGLWGEREMGEVGRWLGEALRK